MRSFGLARKGIVLIRRDDKVPFDVLMAALDRAYVQRTLCLRHFDKWYRSLPRNCFGSITYEDVRLGERLTCTEYPGVRWVVSAKDDEMREIIVVHGFVATDPSCWELSLPG